MTLKICHLVDDLNPGGVTRLLDFIKSSGLMAELGEHQVICTGLGAKSVPNTDADVIVSHLSVNWANLPFFVRLRTRYLHKSLIHIEHSYSEAFLKAHVPSRRRFRALLKTSYAVFDRVVAVSTRQGNWLRDFAVTKPGKLVVIQPCVDLSAFLALSPTHGRKVRKIGLIGRLHDQKGFDIAIEAFKRAGLEDVTLEIFGNGPEEVSLFLRADGSKQIRFHGHTDDPVAAMNSMDAIVMPSRREPYGLVALEALAAGRRLLVSGVDGLSDHVRAGAVQVTSNTPEAWVRALKILAATADDTAIDHGRSSAQMAERRFAQNWARLLSDL